MDVPELSRSRSPHAPVLVAGCRTPIGTAGHSLANLTVTELAAPVLAEVARRAAPLNVAEVMLGNCLGPGGNVARSAALAAGLGVDVPAASIDRQCASGLEAIRLAAMTVASGAATVVLAGGAESASTAPWRYWPPDPASDAHADPPELTRYSRAPFAPVGFPDPDMGVAADTLARSRGISRTRQDDYAARSHARAMAAQDAGRFANEIVALGDVGGDERTRAMTSQRLSRFPPAFSRSHGADDKSAADTVTAGNSSGISDGAAAVAVTTGEQADRWGMPAVEICGAAVIASDTAAPGATAAPAARKVLRQAGISIERVGAIEVTEAFASVAIAFADEIGVDETRLCADGGAIALGHPWGASGAVLVVRLLAQLFAPDGPEYGLAACAAGGGQGVALLLRRCGAQGDL